MPIGKIEECKVSSSGRGLSVKIGGINYGAALKSQLQNHVGEIIDFEVTTSGDSRYVGSWGPATLTPAIPTTMNLGPRPSPANTSVGGELTEPQLRFVSNVVGSAIMAKTLTDPIQISIWAKAAALTVREL